MSEPTSSASSPSVLANQDEASRGHIGLIVLGSIVGGLALGLVLVLVVFAGASEPVITGAALISLACGMLTLFALSSRRTDQPQRWALAPAVGVGVVGIALIALTPSDHVLGLLGWVWPPLLAILVVWSVRGARRSLHNWSRRALLYPAFFVLGLIAIGGAFETVAEATTSNSPSAGRSYLVDGHRLFLNCVGSGSPTVVLFNGLGERTPAWAWVQEAVARETRVCTFDRAGQGWSGEAPERQDGHELATDLHGLLSAAHIPRPLRPCRSLRRRYLRPRLRDGLSKGHCGGRADRLRVPASVRPPVVSRLLFVVAPCLRSPTIGCAGWNRPTH